MSISLNAKDRARLEQLERGRRKSVRRQKAIALLRLAAGLSSAEAAEDAGIPMEAVESLAADFLARGLSGVRIGGTPKLVVSLVCLGVGIQRFCLPNKATLADLLRESDAVKPEQTVYLDGLLAEKSAPLHDGAVVTILPSPTNGAIEAPWRATIPSLRDEALFQQYTATLKAHRRGLGSDEDQEA